MLKNQIETILSSSDQKQKDIIDLFESVGSNLPVIPLHLRSDSKLIRGVINWIPGHFNLVSQLSYKPARLNTEYLRASTPGNTMFYACSFTHSPSFENGVFLPRITALMEIRSILTEAHRDGIQRVTFSRWDSTKDILLFAFPFFSAYPKSCVEIKIIQEQWENAMSQRKYHPTALELIKYLAEDISLQKDRSDDYMFTALFIDWFLSRHPEYSGVYYPSVQTDGEGANIALKPCVVDSGSIRFIDATECWIIKRGARAEVVKAFQLSPNKEGLEVTPFNIYKQIEVMPNPISIEGLSLIN